MGVGFLLPWLLVVAAAQGALAAAHQSEMHHATSVRAPVSKELAKQGPISLDLPFLTLFGQTVGILATSGQSAQAFQEFEDFEDVFVVGLFAPKGIGTTMPVTIPTAIGRATNLLILFSESLATGTIPSEIALAQSLESLIFGNSNVEGTIPTELCTLPSLQHLRLFALSLSGTLPSQLGQLVTLETLEVHTTSISGTIPSELGRLTNVELLKLAYNNLVGTLPSQLSNLSNLLRFEIRFNSGLSGVFPAALSEVRASYWFVGDTQLLGSSDLQFSNAEEISVPNVRFSTPLPLLGAFNRTQKLLFPRCDLFGTIPPGLAAYELLGHLELTTNRLSGPIPSQLGIVSSLTVLELSENQLSSIPLELLHLTHLSLLRVGSNKLVGSLATEIGRLGALREMDLSNNLLAGTLPSQLGKLTLMAALLLHTNTFFGTLPSQLALLVRLTALQLHSNMLQGSIPAALFSLGELNAVSLGDNRLQGTVSPGAASAWLSDCDDSGLDERKCDYRCGSCGSRGLELRPCDWKGRGQWCLNAEWAAAMFLGFVLAATALHWSARQKERPDAWRGVAQPVSRSIFQGLEATMDVLFAARTTGAAFAIAVTTLVVVAVVRAALCLHVERRFEHRLTLGHTVFLALFSVLDQGVIRDAAVRAGVHLPDGYAVLLIAVALAESTVEGTLQLLSLLENGVDSILTVIAFVFSASSFCTVSTVGVILSLAHLHSSNVRPEGKHPIARQLTVRTKKAMLACFCLSVAVGGGPLMSRTHPPDTVVRSSLPLDAPVVGAWPLATRRHGPNDMLRDADLPTAQLVWRKQAEMGCSTLDLSEINPPLMCSLGEPIAVLDLLGPLQGSPFHLTTLRFLALVEELSIVIPTTIGLLSLLKLCLFAKSSTALPSQIGLLTDLVVFDYAQQLGAEQVPSELGSLAAVEVLRIRTATTGTLPSELGRLANLQVLDVTEMTLDPSNTIPSQLGQATSLNALTFSSSTVWGSFPTQVGLLGNLTVLLAANVRLQGTVPTQFSALSLLTTLDLATNSLVGEVADQEFLTFPNLQFFDVSQNLLSGRVFPSSPWTPPQDLTHLAIHSNAFVGTVPTQLGLASLLTTLAMHANHLDGALPSQLSRLQRLSALSLAHNDFAGSIPSQLALLTGLDVVSIAGNRFEGTLPAAFSEEQREVWLADCDYSGLSETRCKRECPACSLNQLELKHCNPRGYKQYCLPFVVLLAVAGLVGLGVQVGLEWRLVRSGVPLRVVAAAVLTTTAVLHLILDTIFLVSAERSLRIVGTIALAVSIFARLLVTANEFTRLQLQNRIHISDHFKLVALGMVLCAFDSSIVPVLVRALEDAPALDRKLCKRAGVACLVHDLPMLCVQVVAVASGQSQGAVQALAFTVLSLVLTSWLWLPEAALQRARALTRLRFAKPSQQHPSKEAAAVAN